jgi:hypothetical protein
MAFRVGQKVVYVGGPRPKMPAYGRAAAGQMIPLTKGVVYTIRDLDDIHGILAVRLIEVVNDTGNYFRGREEPWYYLERFRPVVDISDLQAIVREQLLGKPRHIAPDKFDKQRIHSAQPQPRDDARIAGFPWPAGAAVTPVTAAPPNSRADAASCRPLSPCAPTGAQTPAAEV